MYFLKMERMKDGFSCYAMSRNCDNMIHIRYSMRRKPFAITQDWWMLLSC